MSEAAGLTLAQPAWFWLALSLLFVAWLRRRSGQRVLVVPFASQWAGEAGARSRAPAVLLALGLALLCLALARPQRLDRSREVKQKGYDIVLAVDLSGSMLAEDYEQEGRRANRLQAIQPIVEAFIARRPSDRIGVVAFGGRAYTLSPLTFDHDWLRRQLARLRVGLIEDGTAVGDALALAVSRLDQRGREDSGRRLGGFVVLLTDGASNAGALSPEAAAGLAQARGIPVYTIGAGHEGPVPMPVFDEENRKIGYERVLSDLDEASLRGIARTTGGRYFRAADAETVDAAFAAIDSERKIEFDAKSRARAQDLYAFAAAPGLACCLAAFGLARPGRQEVWS
jgi:Ca-activated chloride channel family protein